MSWAFQAARGVPGLQDGDGPAGPSTALRVNSGTPALQNGDGRRALAGRSPAGQASACGKIPALQRGQEASG